MNELSIRSINLDQDYELLSRWLMGHNKPIISQDLFSDIGFMISNNKMDLVAGFLYTTNSKVCYIENFISNPKSIKDQRRQAINKLFETIINHSKQLDLKLILTYAELNSLISNLEKLDFKPLPTNKVYFRSL